MTRNRCRLFAIYFLLPAVALGGLEGLRAEEKAMPPPPSINARSALLFDARTGRVLFRKNENDPMPVASTQKLLTALLIVEAGDLDRIVTITEEDTKAAPTKLYLKAGEKYTRRELLKALLIRSPNDVAVALARDHSGSVEAFALAMNNRIRRLGAKVSNFVNPSGLPAAEQLSTAREIAAVARVAYFNPTIRQIVNMPGYNFRRNNGSTTALRNTNTVLRTNPYCNGMKTGYTRASGHCLVSSATRDNRHVIAVVLGSNKAQVWGESSRLLDYGLALADRPGPRPTHISVPYRPPSAAVSPAENNEEEARGESGEG